MSWGSGWRGASEQRGAPSSRTQLVLGLPPTQKSAGLIVLHICLPKGSSFPGPRSAQRGQEEAAASLQIMGASKGCRGVGRGHTLVCVQDDLMLSTTSASPHPRDAEQPVSVVCLLLSPQGWGGAEPGQSQGGSLAPSCSRKTQ